MYSRSMDSIIGLILLIIRETNEEAVGRMGHCLAVIPRIMDLCKPKESLPTFEEYRTQKSVSEAWVSYIGYCFMKLDESMTEHMKLDASQDSAYTFTLKWANEFYYESNFDNNDLKCEQYAPVETALIKRIKVRIYLIYLNIHVVLIRHFRIIYVYAYSIQNDDS